MDFSSTKGFAFVGCDMEGCYGCNKGYFELKKTTAQCASIARRKTKY